MQQLSVTMKMIIDSLDGLSCGCGSDDVCRDGVGEGNRLSVKALIDLNGYSLHRSTHVNVYEVQ